MEKLTNILSTLNSVHTNVYYDNVLLGLDEKGKEPLMAKLDEADFGFKTVIWFMIFYFAIGTILLTLTSHKRRQKESDTHFEDGATARKGAPKKVPTLRRKKSFAKIPKMCACGAYSLGEYAPCCEQNFANLSNDHRYVPWSFSLSAAEAEAERKRKEELYSALTPSFDQFRLHSSWQ